MRSVYTQYFQKSKVFLYPLLKLKRGISHVPIETYVSWDGVYSTNDFKFLCVYHCERDDKFKKFESIYLRDHKMLENIIYLSEDRQLYIFDYSKYKYDFRRFIEGKYSKFSIGTKNLILNFFGNVGNISDSVAKILGGPDATDADKKGINTTKTLESDQAANNYAFVGNKHKAFDIIHRLQAKAGGSGFDDDSKSDYGFLFFENHDGYHFKSMRALFEPEPEFEYTKLEGSSSTDFKIEDYNFSNGNDVVINLKSGLYNNEAIFVELDKTKITTVKFNMSDVEDLSFKPPELPIKLDGDQSKPSKIMLRVIDTGVHQHYEENSTKEKDRQPVADLPVYQNKAYARFALLNSQSLNITVGLNPDLRAGQTIMVKFPTTEYKKEMGDEKSNDISGKYLISHLRHEFEGGEFRTHLRLIRDLFTPENA